MRKKAFTREERSNMVIVWFGTRIQHDNESVASLNEIARGLGMSPSSHLRSILSDMVNSGTLEETKLTRLGRWDGRGYMLKQSQFTRPAREQRAIKITHKGLTQMEFFKDE